MADDLLEPHWAVEPAAGPVDAAQLFAEIEARILQHVVMPKDLAFACALYIGLVWVHEHATYSPILGITSAERDSGKSTLMGVIGFLTRRSVLSVGISAAALYRSIEKWHPTFVLDECDELFADNPDLLRVVNSGWTRGQGVIRCDPETNEPRMFSTFCPKIIALKGKKMPDTMLSRTIFISMKRRLRSEKVDHFRHLDDSSFQRMRSQLARWAQDCGEALGLIQPAQPEGFMNRMAANWQLIFAIADSLGTDAGARARAVAQQIAGVIDMASAGVALLRDIKIMFEASTLDYLTSKAILENLTSDPEKQWAEWSRGKAITEKGVAQLLHEYGIFSRNVGSRESQTKGYRKADFKDAWERYISPRPLESSIFPSTRPPPCDDYTFAEKNAVDEPSVDGSCRPPSSSGREKNGPFSSEINAVDGWTAKTSKIDPSGNIGGTDQEHGGTGGRRSRRSRRATVSCEPVISEEEFQQEIASAIANVEAKIASAIADDDPVCLRCGVGANGWGPLVPCGANGSAGLYHLRCWTEQRTKGGRRKPALGPEGDSLDDLK